ncbi:hypothetical protein ACQ4PT_022851 [Festuca glaucescens]
MDSEIQYELPGLIRVHKSGFVERLQGTETSPPSPSGDPANGVASKDVVLGDPASKVSVRLYLPANAAAEPGKKLPVVVFFYGGAFVVSTGAYDDVFAGLKAVVAACRPDGAEPWLASYGDASRIVLVGDSAGANMAHHTAMRLRKEPIEGYGDEVRGVALLYSYFWGKEPLGGEPTDAAVRGRFERSWEVACDGKFGPDHPYINPFSAPQEEWRQLGCRRVLVTTGDWFVERSRAYAEAIKACGWDGELDFYETKGKGHVYFLFNPDGEDAIKDLAVVADFVRRC